MYGYIPSVSIYSNAIDSEERRRSVSVRLNYSLLRATIGDSLDAFHAGYIPATRLRPTDIPHTVARSEGRKTGDILPIPLLVSPSGPPADPNPASNPDVAPRIPIMRASTMKRLRTLLFCAPMAFIVPISFVLSITEV